MQPPAPAPAMMLHIFVDYENVQSIDLASVGERDVRVTVLLGKSQTKLPVGLVQQMLRQPARMRLIEMQHAGRNALDFALSFYLGQAVAADSGGTFRIVSRDKGFDALVKHLRNQNIAVERSDAFSLPDADATIAPRSAANDRVELVLAKFAKHSGDRPKRKRTLHSHINSWFQKKLEPAEVDAIVRELQRRDVIQIDARGVVTYR